MASIDGLRDVQNIVKPLGITNYQALLKISSW